MIDFEAYDEVESRFRDYAIVVHGLCYDMQNTVEDAVGIEHIDPDIKNSAASLIKELNIIKEASETLLRIGHTISIEKCEMKELASDFDNPDGQ